MNSREAVFLFSELCLYETYHVNKREEFILKRVYKSEVKKKKKKVGSAAPVQEQKLVIKEWNIMKGQR